MEWPCSVPFSFFAFMENNIKIIVYIKNQNVGKKWEKHDWQFVCGMISFMKYDVTACIFSESLHAYAKVCLRHWKCVSANLGAVGLQESGLSCNLYTVYAHI